MNAIVSNSTVSPILSTLASAQALVTPGQSFVVSAGRKKSGDTPAWERHVIVPSFASSLDALGDWSSMVNAVLVRACSQALLDFVERNGGSSCLASEFPLDLVSVDNLRAAVLLESTGGMDRAQLERAWIDSKTWQGIIKKEVYQRDSRARAMADLFKERVLALAGRSTDSISDNDLNIILAKLADEDLNAPVGLFICKRISQIRKNREVATQELDIDAF